MQNFLFYVIGVLMVICAVMAVTSPYIFRAALYLAATLALTAVQYVLMQAEFVAVVQLMVYVGAVIILIIFAVMLTAQLGEGNISQTNKLALPAFLISLALGFGLWKILYDYDWSKAASTPAAAAVSPITYNNVQSIGAALVNDYVYPFEIIGLLLFTALVGAVLIARKDPGQ